MKKLFTIALIFALSLSPLKINAATSPKAGASCSKAGLSQIYNKLKFTCIKSGKKLVWDSGVSTSSTLPLPKLPFTLPVTSKSNSNSVTFTNILEKISEIPNLAWSNSQETLKKNIQPDVPIDLAIGPNTIADSEFFNKTLKLGTKLWSSFPLPSAILGTVYNKEDIPWAMNRIKSFPNQTPESGDITRGVRDGIPILQNCPNDCTYSANMGILDPGSKAMGNFGVPPVGAPKPPVVLNGGYIVHELTHSVQGAQFLTSQDAQPGRTGVSVLHANNVMTNEMPCWIIEGSANFAGYSATSTTIEDYLAIRNGEAAGRTDPSLKNYSAEEFKTYLFGQIPGKCRPMGNQGRAGSSSGLDTAYNLGYGVGMLTVEALASIGGVESTMALFTLVASGYSFSESFSKVYGISWDAGSTILSKVLEAEFKTPDIASKMPH
jgi:hypothetical protein